MACNVFGTPITEDTLRAIPEYHDKKNIGRYDLATVALDMKNAEHKDTNARKFVENLRDASSGKVKTMCLIYNATGYPLILVNAHDWHGCICESPYPAIIANGQWGAFLHGQNDGGSECSRAAVVYANSMFFVDPSHWVISWHNSAQDSSKRVYAEICEPGHHKTEDSAWAAIDNLLSNQGKTHMCHAKGREGIIIGSIGNMGVPVFEAILTLEGTLRAGGCNDISGSPAFGEGII